MKDKTFSLSCHKSHRPHTATPQLLLTLELILPSPPPQLWPTLLSLLDNTIISNIPAATTITTSTLPLLPPFLLHFTTNATIPNLLLLMLVSRATIRNCWSPYRPPDSTDSPNYRPLSQPNPPVQTHSSTDAPVQSSPVQNPPSAEPP